MITKTMDYAIAETRFKKFTLITRICTSRLIDTKLYTYVFIWGCMSLIDSDHVRFETQNVRLRLKS